MTDEFVSTLERQIATQILKEPKRQIRPDEKLLSSGLIDSMSLMDLALLVEDNYGVRMDDTELNKETFDTLDELAAFIKERK